MSIPYPAILTKAEWGKQKGILAKVKGDLERSGVEIGSDDGLAGFSDSGLDQRNRPLLDPRCIEHNTVRRRGAQNLRRVSPTANGGVHVQSAASRPQLINDFPE